MSDQLKPIEEIDAANKKGSSVISSSDNAKESLSDSRENLFECRSCGYVYDPNDGVKKYAIARGTSFFDLDQKQFKCPVCRLGVENFKDIGPRSQPSGFEENLNYGLGINNMTPGQKNVLIFGGLAFAFACFLSLYSLH